MKKLSSTVMKILKEQKGYRCEAISSGRHEPSDVAKFEIEELGNSDETALAQYCNGLGLPKEKCTFSTIYEMLREGYDGKYYALWFTTKNFAKKRYCDPGERPMEFSIPPDSRVIQDLDEEGGLFLIEKNGRKRRIAEICRLDNENQGNYMNKIISGEEYKERKDELHKEYSELTHEDEVFHGLMSIPEDKWQRLLTEQKEKRTASLKEEEEMREWERRNLERRRIFG